MMTFVHLIEDHKQSLTIIRGSDGGIVVQAYRHGTLGDGQAFDNNGDLLIAEDGQYNELVFEYKMGEADLGTMARQLAAFAFGDL
jgi:hypothetical protein